MSILINIGDKCINKKIDCEEIKRKGNIENFEINENTFENKKINTPKSILTNTNDLNKINLVADRTGKVESYSTLEKSENKNENKSEKSRITKKVNIEELDEKRDKISITSIIMNSSSSNIYHKRTTATPTVTEKNIYDEINRVEERCRENME